MKTEKQWDIFCRVIDNYGDIGVCWRLAAGLAQRGQQVHLWVDDPGALAWMAPQGAPGVQVQRWTKPMHTEGLKTGDILVEAFGCDIAPEYIAVYAEQTRARGRKPIWINLEYLSAESYARRNHGLPSPVMSGPGAGITKHFFYPGFVPATGGLLREPDLMERQARFDRTAWLANQGIAFRGERMVSLFCYEPAALSGFLAQLAAGALPTRLLVTAGRASAAVLACIQNKNQSEPLWNKHNMLSFSYLPRLTQREFDHLLWNCDLNLVRGEDSLVRALWAGKPLVWQLYPQHDRAHHAKLEAFLDVVNAPESLRVFSRIWNDAQTGPLPTLCLPDWEQAAIDARSGLLAHDDLVTQVMRFAQKPSKISGFSDISQSS